VTLPTSAIQRSAQSTFVFVIKPDGTVEIRNVVVRLSEGDVAAISRGVSDGELVATDGLDKLQPGARVTVRRGDAKSTPETSP
jgi:multidrug efflux system membrane fusion protein